MPRNDVPSRMELTGRQQELNRSMDGKVEDMEIVAGDNVLTADTLERLEFNGTDDGTREVEDFMRAAQDITVDRFEEEDRVLESHQSDNQELEGELDDRSDASDKDLERVNDASADMETRDALGKVREAADAVSRDLEYLQKTLQDAVREREESEREQKRLEDSIRRT